MSRSGAASFTSDALHLAPWGPPPAYRPPAAAAAEALIELYRKVDAALADVAAACEACGACCRFDRTKPVLFASALELAHLLTAASRPVDGSLPTLDVPDAPWRCPHQDGSACTARAARPLGCRTYFCEPGARREGERVHDDALKVIRDLSSDHGYPWWYGPVRHWWALLQARRPSA